MLATLGFFRYLKIVELESVSAGRNLIPLIRKVQLIIDKKLKPLDKMGKIQPIESHHGFIPNEGYFEHLPCRTD